MFPFLPFAKKKEPEEAEVNEDFYAHREEIASSVRKGRNGSKSKKGSPQDPLLSEKKRARRRLVGAVALVLGLIIMLPMVFDSEPKSKLDDIDIRIPSKEKVLPSGPSMPTDAPVEPREAVPSKPETVKPETVKPETVKPETVKSGKTVAETTHATGPTSGKLVIQVVALSSQKKVNEIRTRLKHAGIKSYEEKTSNKKGAPIRVRVGPFATQGAAEATCAKLMMMELGCTIMPN